MRPRKASQLCTADQNKQHLPRNTQALAWLHLIGPMGHVLWDLKSKTCFWRHFKWEMSHAVAESVFILTRHFAKSRQNSISSKWGVGNATSHLSETCIAWLTTKTTCCYACFSSPPEGTHQTLTVQGYAVCWNFSLTATYHWNPKHWLFNLLKSCPILFRFGCFGIAAEHLQ